MSQEEVVIDAVPTVEVGELLTRLDAGEEGLAVLDVRNDEEFRDWKLEGRRPVETRHVPYFDFIEDAEASIAKLPRGRDLVVLCAQGGSSEMVVGLLQDAGIPSRNVKGGMVAYGEHLQPVKVPLPPAQAERFELWQLNRRGKGCLSYVIRSGDQAVVVDPSRHAERYLTFVAGLGARIVQVLDTHVHADHVSGGPLLARLADAPYFVAAGGDFELRQEVKPLRDGQTIRLGGVGGVDLQVSLLSTPGHTPGSTSYRVDGRYLLTGDTIFVAGVGRPDLGGHVDEWGRMLHRTLRERLASLPDDTVVLPAHYGGIDEIGEGGVVSARLGDLRRTVPEMQIMDEEEFVEAVRSAVTPPPASYAEIIRTNLGLAHPLPLAFADDEKVREWELGKNQCAVAAQGRRR